MKLKKVYIIYKPSDQNLTKKSSEAFPLDFQLLCTNESQSTVFIEPEWFYNLILFYNLMLLYNLILFYNPILFFNPILIYSDFLSQFRDVPLLDESRDDERSRHFFHDSAPPFAVAGIQLLVNVQVFLKFKS